MKKDANAKTKEATIKTIKIVKIILDLAAGAGLVSMAALAPNAVQCIEMFWGKDKRSYSSRYYVKNMIYKLKSRGLINFENKDGKTFLRLTDRGQKELLKYQLREKMIKKPRKWDNKWRVIIFDIEEQARNLRDGLRMELANLGFVRLQNSVWVHPYECEDVIAMIKTYFGIGKDVLYMTVEKMENDKWLKEEFGLI